MGDRVLVDHPGGWEARRVPGCTDEGVLRVQADGAAEAVVELEQDRLGDEVVVQAPGAALALVEEGLLVGPDEEVVAVQGQGPPEGEVVGEGVGGGLGEAGLERPRGAVEGEEVYGAVVGAERVVLGVSDGQVVALEGEEGAVGGEAEGFVPLVA
jgi:hypothetical protein